MRKLVNFILKLSDLFWGLFFSFAPVTCFRWFSKSQCGDLESKIVFDVTKVTGLCETFVEFGFQPHQFNSVALVKSGWKGLVVDGCGNNVALANSIFERVNPNVRAIEEWITLDNLDFVKTFSDENGGNLGVLNVDVDGNDFWFLKEILSCTKPGMIIVEYNASLGLRSISVPYHEDFNRYKYSDSGLYHGASITAFIQLLADEYDLIENIAGLNLVFLQKRLNKGRFEPLREGQQFKEHSIRCARRGDSSSEQFSEIAHLLFVETP